MQKYPTEVLDSGFGARSELDLHSLIFILCTLWSLPRNGLECMLTMVPALRSQHTQAFSWKQIWHGTGQQYQGFVYSWKWSKCLTGQVMTQGYKLLSQTVVLDWLSFCLSKTILSGTLPLKDCNFLKASMKYCI